MQTQRITRTLVMLAVLFCAVPRARLYAQSCPATLPDLKLWTAGVVNAMAVLDDGRIVIGGEFTAVNGVPRHNLALINADGSVDPRWDPSPSGSVHALVLTGDGVTGQGIIAGGAFISIGGTTRSGLAKLKTWGRGDVYSTWNAGLVLPYSWPWGLVGEIRSLAVEGTSLYVGGYFSFASVGSVGRTNIAKLNDSGDTVEVDSTWEANTGVIKSG